MLTRLAPSSTLNTVAVSIRSSRQKTNGPDHLEARRRHPLHCCCGHNPHGSISARLFHACPVLFPYLRQTHSGHRGYHLHQQQGTQSRRPSRRNRTASPLRKRKEPCRRARNRLSPRPRHLCPCRCLSIPRKSRHRRNRYSDNQLQGLGTD